MTQPIPSLEYQTPQKVPANSLNISAIALIITGALTLICIGLDLISKLLMPRGSGLAFNFGLHIGPPETTILFNAIAVPLTILMIISAVHMLKKTITHGPARVPSSR